MKTMQARWYHKGRISKIRAVVIHTMEAPENAATAENVANYFRTTGTQASAHVCVDSNSAVRCVADEDTAWAAPGCNADGLQLEIAGRARQNETEWQDPFSKAALHQAALVTSDWCTKWGIPARRLTVAELKAGRKGITSHADVSAVYKRSDHTDPGPNFPWAAFLSEVKGILSGGDPGQVPPTDTNAAPEWRGRSFRLVKPYMTGTDVKMWQRQMRARGSDIAVDGVYGPQSADAAKWLQRGSGISVNGVVGQNTWSAAWTPVKA